MSSTGHAPEAVRGVTDAIERVLASKAAVEQWKSCRLAIIDKVAELGRLPYNHDKGGGLPIRDDVLHELYVRLLGTYGLDLRNLPTPIVGLTKHGTVALNFIHGARRVRIEVACKEVVEYSKYETTDSVTSMVPIVQGFIKLPKCLSPSTGYTVEIDEQTLWLLQANPAPLPWGPKKGSSR